MYAESLPWKILSSHIHVGVETEGWGLSEVADESGGERCFEVPVYFDAPFAYAPVVQLGLTGFDLDQRDSPRLRVRAEAVTESGFTAVVATWSTTRAYGVELQWTAIGA